jgi:hypothetical protein
MLSEVNHFKATLKDSELLLCGMFLKTSLYRPFGKVFTGIRTLRCLACASHFLSSP